MIAYEIENCYIRVFDTETNEDTLVQVDYDYPGLASTFGWSVSSVQPTPPDECPHGEEDWRTCAKCAGDFGKPLLERTGGGPCDHSGTDGTVDCPDCGMKAGDFIGAAYDFLVEHEGDEAEDPGYFGG